MLLADLVRIEDLVPFALFGLFAVVAWWLLERMAASKPRAIERLDEIRNPRRRSILDDAPVKKDKMAAVLEKASPLAKPLAPKNEQELGKLRAKLAEAGFRSEAAGGVFLGLKFLGLMLGLVIGGATGLFTHGVTQKSLLITVLTAGVFFYLPGLIVWFIASKRKEAIFLGLPDALDLMVVCVEAGLGLDQAMRKVSDEMKKSYPIISEEFSLANFQLQMGRPRTEVLHELGQRNGVADLRSLAAVLIQADKFGTGIAQALRVQSDAMRTRRRQLAEEKAAKTAVKLIFPLVLFIFPGIFVVLVGPAAVTMVRELFPKMAG